MVACRLGTARLRRVAAVAVLAAAVGFGSVLGMIGRSPRSGLAALAWAHGARVVDGPRGVRQRRANDCGPAALAHVLRELGLAAPYPDPGSPLALGPRGCRLDEIAREATRRGLVARVRRADPSVPEGIRVPAILHLAVGHFVVLEGRSVGGEWLVHDPSLGSLAIPPKTLARQWSGWVLELSLPERSPP
jgi:hypothetical protein